MSIKTSTSTTLKSIMNPRKYHLVLSGSGADFPCFIGALKALQSRYTDFLQNLVSVSASSGGALVSLLMLLKFSVSVMEDLCFTIEYEKHLQRVDLANLLGGYGLDNANNMVKIIKRVVRQKLGNENATFADLHAFNPCLYNVTGTNLSTMSLKVFNHAETPNLPLWKAIRITTSVPFMFTSIRLDDDIFCDGAILSYYPIQLVPEATLHDQVIGICLDKADERNVIDDLLSYTMALAKTLTHQIHHMSFKRLRQSQAYDEIILRTNGTEIYLMDRDKNQKRALIDAGFTQTMTYLARDTVIVRHLVRDIFRRITSSIVLNKAQ